MYVSCLDFYAPEALDKVSPPEPWTKEYDILCKRERRKYVKWVNKVLQSHKALALDGFRIYFDLTKSSRQSIDKWLQYAIDRKVQRLELNLLEHGMFRHRSPDCYTLPVGFLGLRCGKSSDVGNPRAVIDFKSLKALSLKSVNVSGEVLEFFIYNCKFLERLVVHDSGDLITFKVSGPCVALKHLEICYCNNLKCLNVCSVNLVSLKTTRAQKLLLKSVPMLANVYANGLYHDIVGDVLPRLSCCLSTLEVLALGFFYNEATQLKVWRSELPQLTTLKQLILNISARGGKSLLRLVSLIRAAPNLEKLVIKLNWVEEINRRRRKLKKAVNYPFHHLKVFELSGYYGRTCDLELIKYFVENAISLEKIIIDPRKPCGFERLLMDWEIKEHKVARAHAKERLKGLISSHVELVIS
ncbi:hypothetical protein ACH5RR_026551 [Cinchona calisaya]|uniref:At1g61320/AtMIF1 LRR domain-containing protein n=1 Tax=Cinchona calisaya TaxID=153742 RepID=A0ABD2Z4Y8_9GENT